MFMLQEKQWPNQCQEKRWAQYKKMNLDSSYDNEASIDLGKVASVVRILALSES